MTTFTCNSFFKHPAVIFICCILFISNRFSAQCSCTPTSAFPATVNGITISLSNTGSVTNYGANWPSCGLSAGPMWVGSAGAFSQTFTFSQPVNNVSYVITAASGSEAFSFSVGSGVLTTTQCGGTCPFSQTGNTFTCLGNDDGTIVVLTSTSSFTTFTVSGAGGSNGSLAGICIQSFATCVTPTLTVSPSTVICSSAVQTLTVSGASSYSWSPGSSLSSTTGSIVTASPGITTTYTVTGTSGTCTATALTTVSVIPAPPVSVSPSSATICAGSSTTLSASGAASYTWSPAGSLDTASGATVVASPTTTTTTYTLLASDGTCNVMTLLTVHVISASSLTVSPVTATICAGSSTTLSVSGSSGYTWTPASGLNASTGSSVTASPLVTTIYTVKSGISGCTASSQATVTVNPLPVLSVNPSVATICSGASVILSASGATNYTWTPSSGLSAATGTSVTANPSATTVYSVTGSIGSCIGMATTTVSVISNPALTIVPHLTSGCETLCVNFSETSNLGGGTIHYNFGDGATGNSHNPSHCYDTAGSYTVTAVLSDAGCSATAQPVVILVYPKPTALFTVSEGTIITAGNPAHLVNNSSNATHYVWSICNSVIYVTKDVTTSPLSSGSCCIELVAVSANGCKDSVTSCITVNAEVSFSIPNVFTPNNDSRNDLFKITAQGVSSFNCGIYDRWGLKMYEWNDVNGSWDGKTKTSAPAPDGSYFYIINYTTVEGISKTEKGFLSLFRN